MLLVFSITLCADLPLGKVEKSTLSEDILLELLIEKMTANTERIRGNEENSWEVSEWNGLELNAQKNIGAIKWSNKGLTGGIQLEYLPRTTRRAYFDNNSLSGDLCLTDLPEGLVKLAFSNNKFSTTVDLTRLPSTLAGLFLDKNPLFGVTDFSRLPSGLVWLWMNDTLLSGTVCAKSYSKYRADNSNVTVIFEDSSGLK
mmetsp:Transcript_6907/g.10459  ORF Transcript_6907/g.10459 Transcript_6907/m.10459 type:complete len:200 (+) Transcript_6907:34-633(+)